MRNHQGQQVTSFLLNNLHVIKEETVVDGLYFLLIYISFPPETDNNADTTLSRSYNQSDDFEHGHRGMTETVVQGNKLHPLSYGSSCAMVLAQIVSEKYTLSESRL